jgi:hypothetical protein
VYDADAPRAVVCRVRYAGQSHIRGMHAHAYIDIGGGTTSGACMHMYT